MNTDLQSEYPLDSENVAEMARLTRQARVTTELTGLLPDGLMLADESRVLDLGCGPGEWVLALARRFPNVEVTGVDISQLMISYNRSLAREEGLHNAHFRIMDVRQAFSFPDGVFDLIHGRFLNGITVPSSWPAILAECWRVLKPGGQIVLVEGEGIGINTSPSLTRANILGMTAMHRAGRCFNSEGEQIGITAVQPRLLSEAGFGLRRREAFALDYSKGAAAHDDMCQDWIIAFNLGAPFIERMGMATKDELALLITRAAEEMEAPDFSAVVYNQRLWAEKPA